MWTRKDLAILAVAAVGTFGMTVAVFLPQTVSAVDDSPATTAIARPVLKVGDCEVSAMAEVAVPVKAGGNDAGVGANNMVQLTANTEMPTVMITVRNTTDKATKASFVASVTGSGASSPMSRTGGTRMQQQWVYKYDLDLKPGESRDVEVKTGVKMASGFGAFNLQTQGQNATAISAFNFVVGQGSNVTVNGSKTVRVGQRQVTPRS